MRVLGRIFAGLLVGATIWSGVAHAQAGSSAEKQKAILELIQAVGMADMLDQMADVSINMTFDTVRRKNPNLTDADIKIVSDAIRQTVRETAPGILARFAVIYDELFTYEEISDINTFYRTQSGKKVLQLMPQIMQRGMQAATEWAKEAQPLITERVRAQAKQRGIQLDM